MKLTEFVSTMEENGTRVALKDVITDGVGNILKITLTDGGDALLSGAGYILAKETDTETGLERVYIPKNEQRDAFIDEELSEIERTATDGTPTGETVLRLCSVARSLQDSLREQREQTQTLLEMIEERLISISK